MNVLLVAVALVLSASPIAAQTIRPLVSEFQREARGRFEVVNDSDRPLNVVLEPRGFSVGEDGQMRDAPMPPGVRLRMSDTSFRLLPKASRFVFYEATGGPSPVWFVIYANLTGFPARDFSGLNVQLELPHIVYLLSKEQWKEGDVRVAEAVLRSEDGTFSIVVENRGASFGRVASVTVQGTTRDIDVPGFPLFPGGRRRIDIPWTDRREPEAIAVDARNFSFEHRLRRD